MNNLKLAWIAISFLIYFSINSVCFLCFPMIGVNILSNLIPFFCVTLFYRSKTSVRVLITVICIQSAYLLILHYFLPFSPIFLVGKSTHIIALSKKLTKKWLLQRIPLQSLNVANAEQKIMQYQQIC